MGHYEIKGVFRGKGGIALTLIYIMIMYITILYTLRLEGIALPSNFINTLYYLIIDIYLRKIS